jgi:hypothetical protein
VDNLPSSLVAVGFFAVPGTTFCVLAIDDQRDGGGNGGTPRISFNPPPPPPTVDMAVDPVTFNARAGFATITGTYTCGNAEFIDVFGEARQAVGRFTIVGRHICRLDPVEPGDDGDGREAGRVLEPQNATQRPVGSGLAEAGMKSRYSDLGGFPRRSARVRLACRILS